MELIESRKVSIESIKIPEWARRQWIKEPEIDDLAESIKSCGQIGPVIVRLLDDGSLELVAGFRRLMALKKLGATEAEAKIIRCSDKEALVLSISENMMRSDEHPFDTARKVAYMHKNLGLSIREIGRMLNRDESWVSMMLKIDSMHPEAKKILAPSIKSYDILYKVAEMEKPEDQIALADKVVREGLTTKEVRKIVRDVKEKGLSVKDVFRRLNTSEPIEHAEPSTGGEMERPRSSSEKVRCEICGKRFDKSETVFKRFCVEDAELVEEIIDYVGEHEPGKRAEAVSKLLKVARALRGLDLEILEEVVEEVRGRHVEGH